MMEVLSLISPKEIFIMFSLFLLVLAFCCLFQASPLNYLYFQIQTIWILYQCVKLGPGSPFLFWLGKVEF